MLIASGSVWCTAPQSARGGRRANVRGSYRPAGDLPPMCAALQNQPQTSRRAQEKSLQLEEAETSYITGILLLRTPQKTVKSALSRSTAARGRAPSSCQSPTAAPFKRSRCRIKLLFDVCSADPARFLTQSPSSGQIRASNSAFIHSWRQWEAIITAPGLEAA